MEMNDLYNLLKEQHKFLETFLDTLSLQQKAIIESDLTGLQETIKAEGSLMVNFKHYEINMKEMISELSNKYSLKVTEDKLSEFINIINNKMEFNSGRFVKLHRSLQDLTNQILKINNQNKLLIDQARNFIKETISALVNNNQNPILDRKI